MEHTIKQIIQNQDSFKKEIESWLKEDFKSQKKILSEIDPDGDLMIEESKKSLEKKIKKIKHKRLIDSLFFKSGSKNRSKKYYAWWNADNEEVIIYTYGKKTADRNSLRLRVRRKSK